MTPGKTCVDFPLSWGSYDTTVVDPAMIGRYQAICTGGDADDFLPLIEDEIDGQASTLESWKVLIVDDDDSVHDATSLALRHVQHRGRPVQMISARSAAQARTILREENDIAMALIDVVMETDHAGLDLLRFIRDDLGNLRIRLVIRTGQAGRFDEASVRRNYPADDFCQKADLTVGRLRDILSAQLDEY